MVTRLAVHLKQPLEMEKGHEAQKIEKAYQNCARGASVCGGGCCNADCAIWGSITAELQNVSTDR